MLSSCRRSLQMATTVIMIAVLSGALYPNDFIQQADAATALAPTISSWNNVCDNCEVLLAGTTLNVLAMTNDAALNSKPRVIFTMTNLLTSGLLLIDCDGNLWTHGIPLRFKVINGMTTPNNTIMQFFKIVGTLAVGSTVEITGGTYYIKDPLFRFFGVSLQMSEGSSIQIKSNSFIQETVLGLTPQMYIWDVSRLTMASSSSIVHSDNILSLDGAVSTTTSFTFVYVFIWSSCLSMSGSSTFLINNNTFKAGTFTSVSGSFGILGIKFRLCAPTFSNSSLTVSDNTFSFVGSTLNGYMSTTLISFDTTSNVSLGWGGSWILSNNRLVVSSTTFGNGAALRGLYFVGAVLVEGTTSKLSVAGTIATFQNVSLIPASLVIYAVDSLTIRNLGLLEVTDSQILIDDGTTIVNEVQINLVRSNSLSVSPEGILRLDRNSVNCSAVVASSTSSSVSIVKTTAASGITSGDINMNYNILDVRGGNLTTAVALFAAGTSLSGLSNMSFKHNRLLGPIGNTYISSSGITFGGTTEVCNNTVHNDLCVVASKRRVTGRYSCIPTTMIPIPNVTDVCANTYTQSLLTTPTASTTATLATSTLSLTSAKTSTPSIPTTSTATTTPPPITSTPSNPTRTLGSATSIPWTPSRYTTTQTHPDTHTPVDTPAITTFATIPTHSTTPSDLTPSGGTVSPTKSIRYVPPCTHSCNDIIAALVVSSSTTVDVITEAYWATYNHSAPRKGCEAVSIVFGDTENGKAVRVLIHVDTGTLTANASYPMLGRILPATPSSTIQATSISTNFSGGVVVLEVRRVDTNPVTSATGLITLPASGFMCSSGLGGLPTTEILFKAPPPSLTAAEQQAITVVSAISPDLQTVAAMSLLRCSPGDPIDAETEATIRALVPVALSGTCAGAVQGAILTVSVVGLIGALATAVLMKIRKVGWIEAAKVTRCPGIALAVWTFMQMGFVVCGARLVRSSSAGDVALGVVGILLAVILPVLCVVLAWKVVSRRCYRIGPTHEVVQSSSKVGLWLRSVLLPEYELDTVIYPISKAYSSIVGRTRLVGSIWACVPMAQPIIMLVVVFVSGMGCSAVLIAAGVLMLLVAAVCQLWFRPHRIFVSNILQAGSMSINAIILIIGAFLASDPTHPTSLTAFRYVSMLQLALSIIRLAHTSISALFMILRRGASFQLVDPMGVLILTPSTATTAGPPVNKTGSTTSHPLLPTTTSPFDDGTASKVIPVFDYLPRPGANYLSTATPNADQQPPPPQQQQHAFVPYPPVTTTPSTSHEHTTINLSTRDEREPTEDNPSSCSQPPKQHQKPPVPSSVVQKVVSFFTTPKNTRNFNQDIVATVLNNHHGYIPMDRPYTLLYEEGEEEMSEDECDIDDTAGHKTNQNIPQHHRGTDDDDRSSSTSPTTTCGIVYARSGGHRGGIGGSRGVDMDDDLSLPSLSGSDKPLSSNSSRASL